MEDKTSIRKRMKAILSNLSEQIYEDYSNKIAQTLYQQDEWKKSATIGITISRVPEVDTYPIIRKAWESGKRVVVPKCDPKEKVLSFRTLTDFSQLESVYFGLLEPIIEETTEMDPKEIDLLIVPGLAFTREGYRLGFGGGYYDRFLLDFTGKTISLAFPEQMIPRFPIEKFDIPVSKIITTNEIIHSYD
ncbi:5-formyltetrahydrofolate cyclo-ligase [Bacillus sp. FJAT-29814]|uniref:5-formyltetrahydrofolate cyclo-ligase n=1 Tax=Bacillus sp. FJAT-29814 TaxID=1729688 RepID=UPI0008310003|nr:5-formyltetrahydrofolate cyclo-ligase [Bacillus sp. FJAT-29814]